MKFTYENTILYLPIVEAKSLRDGNEVSILFEVSPTFVSGSHHSFHYDGSEPVYPANLFQKELNKIAEKYSLESSACKHEERFILSYQLAYFWHFMGDGTHHSEPVLTPFGFYPGQIVTIENRYNVKPMDVIVKKIDLTSFDESKWYWLITLSSI